MNQIIVFSKVVESEMVMFINNRINYDVERYMKFANFLWKLREITNVFLQNFGLVISDKQKNIDKLANLISDELMGFYWNLMQILW